MSEAPEQPYPPAWVPGAESGPGEERGTGAEPGPEPEVAAPGSSVETEALPRLVRPRWRDNIEAVLLAVIMALVLKVFLLEAYKIPTGSMQPNLMGNDDLGVYDRILVDKLRYRWRDPERWEVVVFRYPLDRSKSYVKRLVGMPGEQLRIHLGDLWTRANDGEAWRILRRPRAVQRDTWKRLDLLEARIPAWKIGTGEGRSDPAGARSLALSDGAKARFKPDEGAIMDAYADGYPDGFQPLLPEHHMYSRANPVGDLRVEAEIRAEPDCREVTLEIAEGRLRYEFVLPTGGSAVPQIRVRDAASGQLLREAAPAGLSLAHFEPLSQGRTRRIGAQNLDDVLELDIDGEIACALEIDAQEDQRSGVTISCTGGGAALTDLMVYRDIYYTSANSKVTETAIPAGCYFMLGDNTQDSSDSREWTFKRYLVRDPAHPEGPPVELRANYDSGKNPVTVVGGETGPVVWLTDEWGERHHFMQDMAEPISPVEAPWVPRSMLQGRALAVFWPLLPQLGVYRWKWIH